MIIGVNVRSLGLGIGFGVREASLNILRELVKLDKKNKYIFFSNKDFETDFAGYEKVIYPSGNVKFDWFVLPKLLTQHNVDIFISPQTTLGFVSREIKTISIVHDLGYVHGYYSWMDNLYWKMNLRHALRKSDRVISISDFTKSEIINFFKVPEDKISVIHHGRNYFFERVKYLNPFDLFWKVGFSGQFILCMGSSYHRKNIGKIIEAYNKIKFNIPEKLVIITDSKEKTIKNFGLERTNLNNIILLEKIDAESVRGLYSLAEFTVLPSIYEGFGFPLIEAQACGSMVVNANNSSLHEISNGTTIEFNPFDENDMADKILQALSLSKHEKQNIIDLGHQNIKRFERKDSAQKYLKIIDNLGKK